MKKIIFCALALIGINSSAQTITFDTDDYQSIGVYDTWEQSPFRTGKLTGNAQILKNHLNQVDNVLGEAPNPSENIVGLQRSRFGSNTFGVSITLKEPFRLTKTARYLHVLIYKPVESPVLVCGLGKRTESAWSWQDGTCEQFKVATPGKVAADTWVDVVVPINGFSYSEADKTGIDISTLVICPDLRTPRFDEEDFACYIDQIEINDSPQPRFTTEMYAVSFDREQINTRTNRHLDNVYLNNIITNQLPSTFYNNLTSLVFSATPGESVKPGFVYTGDWMSGYVYVDWGNDGKFNFDILNNGFPASGGDIVSYNVYNPYLATGQGYNAWTKSNGVTTTNGNTIGSAMPNFTIPANTPYGFYRMRYKVDWNSIDPAGNTASNNLITNNGGGITDVTLDVHSDKIKVSEGSLNGQILTADGQTLDNLEVPYGQPFTVKIDPYPGFSHNGVVIRSGYNTASDQQFVNENPQYIIYKFSYDDFDDNNLLTIPLYCMKGGEVLIEGQFIEALKTPYTIRIEGASGDTGGVIFKGVTYTAGSKISVDHTINPALLTAVKIDGHNADIVIKDMEIIVTYTRGLLRGDTITNLSQLSNDKAYFITSLTGEGALVYNPSISTTYVSIKASNGCVQGFPTDNTAKLAYISPLDTTNLCDSWQILKKNTDYYLYNPGGKAFVTLQNRDYIFTSTETPLKLIRTNSAYETTTVNSKNISLKNSFSILGKNGDNNHYACICTNTTPMAVRNWTFNDHGSVFYIIENPNVQVTDIFEDPDAVSSIETKPCSQDNTIHDLSGRRVCSQPDKGIYIINREKVAK